MDFSSDLALKTKKLLDILIKEKRVIEKSKFNAV